MGTLYPLNTLMRRLTDIRATTLVAVITALVVLASIVFFRDARSFIGKSFPGFLSMSNSMVGTLGTFDWPGYKAGLRYHDEILSKEQAPHYRVRRDETVRVVEVPRQTFLFEDFLVVFFAPFASGLLYVILALIIYIVGRHMRGVVPFVLFNLGIGYYLIASFDMHHGHRISWLFLLNFALLPAYMTHFALVFPEEIRGLRRRQWATFLPYGLSIALYFPYVYTFYRAPSSWVHWEITVVFYIVLSYLFWITMLARHAKHAAHQTDRTAASYLLFGQLIAFIIPLTAAVAIFVFERSIPLNVIAPVTVLFPLASLFGLVLGNLRATQLKLVQSEKMASLGTLVAGVAHEINNPTTFIYSNIAMLRDYVSYIRGSLRSDATKFKDEMSAAEVVDDLDNLVDTVADGADRIRSIVADLRRFGHSQDDVVTPVYLRAGIKSTLNLLHHELADRVTVHLDVPPELSFNANPGQINQVWMNLLSNAANAIKDEGNIWIAAHQDANGIHVQIRDDGKGMSRGVLGRIFDPFFTTKPEGQGTGMGLAITQQIIHRWGGEIEVHSEMGKGTTVRVTFPWGTVRQ